jgi:hypothetical protein
MEQEKGDRAKSLRPAIVTMQAAAACQVESGSSAVGEVHERFPCCFAKPFRPRCDEKHLLQVGGRQKVNPTQKKKFF